MNFSYFLNARYMRSPTIPYSFDDDMMMITLIMVIIIVIIISGE